MSKFDLAVILWLPQQLSGLDFGEGSVDKWPQSAVVCK
jgi:hypothetical protein